MYIYIFHINPDEFIITFNLANNNYLFHVYLFIKYDYIYSLKHFYKTLQHLKLQSNHL